MKLYHGTSELGARDAVINGLKPRKDLKHKGNWEHTVDSRRDAVYLTTAYAPYFALNAMDLTKNTNKAAVVEIETDLLFELNLVPDEDAIEQSNQGHDSLPKNWTMEQRTKYYRQNLHKYIDGQWRDSVKLLGNCAYLGRIPRRAITRVAFFDPKENPSWAWACMDPSISVMNYRFMSEKYRLLTAVLFNDPTSDEPEEEKLIKEQMFSYKSTWDIISEFDHSVIEIIT